MGIDMHIVDKHMDVHACPWPCSQAFDALRRGFLHCEDLQIQLAAVGKPRELALVLQGSQSLSVVCSPTPSPYPSP